MSLKFDHSTQLVTCKTFNVDAYVEGLPIPSSSSFLTCKMQHYGHKKAPVKKIKSKHKQLSVSPPQPLLHVLRKKLKGNVVGYFKSSTPKKHICKNEKKRNNHYPCKIDKTYQWSFRIACWRLSMMLLELYFTKIQLIPFLVSKLVSNSTK